MYCTGRERFSRDANKVEQKIKMDPGSEEVQGKNLVRACFDSGVQCFIWSSLPSSSQISGGCLVSKIYEGKFYRQISTVPY